MSPKRRQASLQDEPEDVWAKIHNVSIFDDGSLVGCRDGQRESDLVAVF